ncbi:hypothetical protein TNCV_1343151 [Trichonephila clavipes]|nr:hypothetical protein TNCV_1343151 [Trichonephila clavipes]
MCVGGRIITLPTPMVSKDVLKGDWCYGEFTVDRKRVDIMKTLRIPWLELQNVSLVEFQYQVQRMLVASDLEILYRQCAKRIRADSMNTMMYRVQSS